MFLNEKKFVEFVEFVEGLNISILEVKKPQHSQQIQQNAII